MSSNASALKLAENTSSVVVRIEASSFKANHGPLGLFFMWIAILIVSFSVGANGPPVLSNHGAGQVVNTTTMVNYTDTTNGTVVTFNLHPGMEKQFFSLRLRMRHPGTIEGYSAFTKNSDMSYFQTWAIRGIEHHGGHVAEMHEGLDLDSAHMHHSEMKCRPRNDAGHRKQWCDGQHIYGLDHIRPVGYFFKIFIAHAPPWVVHPSFYETNPAQFDIRVVTMHPNYMWFETGFKYFFFVVTVLVAFTPGYGFIYQMAQVPSANSLSSSHHWIAGMLIGLLWFNEPLMALRVNMPSTTDALEKFAMVCSTAFVAYLLYYWLVLLDDCRLRAQASKSKAKAGGGGDGMTAMEIGGAEPVANPFNFYTKNKEETLGFVLFYFPKMLLVGLIWGLLLATYATLAVETERDPSFQPYTNGDQGLVQETLKALYVTTIIFMVFYLAWALVLVVWACTLVPHIGHAYRWLGGLTVFTMSLVASGVFVGVAYPVPSSSVIFLGFYGMINAYVWIMAIAWTPLPAESLEATVQMTTKKGGGGGGSGRRGERLEDMEDVDFDTKEMV